MAKTQFVTDLEGPLTLNDNAFEVTAHFLPDGARFFALVSRYDDILADIVKRPGYRAGNTLKLIVPFLLAFGVRDRHLREFSRTSIKPVPGALKTLQRIHAQMPTFIVSTSYEPYVRAVCEACAFPFENTYCTRISLDAYELSQGERQKLRSLYSQMVQERDGELVPYLDEVFWGKIWHMGVGRVLREIQPLGGPEKARVLHQIRTGIPLAQTIYVGDSITDVEALELVRQAGGLAIAFNGNSYALRAAELGCISSDASVLAHIAEAFAHHGPDAVRALHPPDAEFTDAIDEAFIQRSEQMRRRLRGLDIGSLG